MRPEKAKRQLKKFLLSFTPGCVVLQGQRVSKSFVSLDLRERACRSRGKSPTLAAVTPEFPMTFDTRWPCFFLIVGELHDKWAEYARENGSEIGYDNYRIAEATVTVVGSAWTPSFPNRKRDDENEARSRADINPRSDQKGFAPCLLWGSLTSAMEIEDGLKLRPGQVAASPAASMA
jgi:hypothetical protein